MDIWSSGLLSDSQGGSIVNACFFFLHSSDLMCSCDSVEEGKDFPCICSLHINPPHQIKSMFWLDTIKKCIVSGSTVFQSSKKLYLQTHEWQGCVFLLFVFDFMPGKHWFSYKGLIHQNHMIYQRDSVPLVSIFHEKNIT